MLNISKDAPKAVGAASGAVIAQVETSSTANIYVKPARRSTRVTVHVVSTKGRFTVVGQVAKALVALVNNRSAGVTAMDVQGWAFRLSAYVHTLRHRYGLHIVTEQEGHEGGWHARYRLITAVVVVARPS